MKPEKVREALLTAKEFYEAGFADDAERYVDEALAALDAETEPTADLRAGCEKTHKRLYVGCVYCQLDELWDRLVASSICPACSGTGVCDQGPVSGRCVRCSGTGLDERPEPPDYPPTPGLAEIASRYNLVAKQSGRPLCELPVGLGAEPKLDANRVEIAALACENEAREYPETSGKYRVFMDAAALCRAHRCAPAPPADLAELADKTERIVHAFDAGDSRRDEVRALADRLRAHRCAPALSAEDAALLEDALDELEARKCVYTAQRAGFVASRNTHLRAIATKARGGE